MAVLGGNDLLSRADEVLGADGKFVVVSMLEAVAMKRVTMVSRSMVKVNICRTASLESRSRLL